MPWEGSNVTRTVSWEQERIDGNTIDADTHDAHDDDLANSISLALRRDGGNSATAAVNMGNNRIRNVSQGSSAGDAVALVNDGGTVKLQPADGSLLTNVPATLSGSTDALDFVESGEPTFKMLRSTGDPTDFKFRVDGLSDVVFFRGDTARVDWSTVNTFEAITEFADGAVTGPGIAFDSDPTTGLYRTGTTAGFAANGQAVWTANASNVFDLCFESTNTTPAVKITPTESQVNYLRVTGSTTGNDVTLATAGSDSNIDLAITPKGTGALVLDGLRWPASDGTNGQALVTNGAGQLSFATGGGGAVSSVFGRTGIVTAQAGDVDGIAINVGFENLLRPLIGGARYRRDVKTHSVAGALTLDVETFDRAIVTLNANATAINLFDNAGSAITPGSDEVMGFVLTLVQGSSAATITMDPSTYVFTEGSQPQIGASPGSYIKLFFERETSIEGGKWLVDSFFKKTA